MQDMQPDNNNNMPMGQEDHEGGMAKADLYKLANYSFKLFKKIQPEDQLEGWVQAKITKAADYIASVYHYLEYEMKFNEYGKALDNSDVMSESQKAALTNMLMEAKAKMKELKKEQAGKVIGKKEVEEGFEAGAKTGSTFKTKTGVATKTASGVKHTNTSFKDEEHAEPASKVKSRSASEKSGDKAADKAAEKESKAYEKAHPGTVSRYKDGKKVNEAASDLKKVGDTSKTKTGVVTKTATGLKHTNTSFKDEEHAEPASKVKSRSAAEKAGDKAADKAAEKESKAYEKAHPGTVSRYKDGKKVNEAAKPDFLDMDKDGNKKEPMKKAVADKKKNPFAKKVDEAKKEKEPEGLYSSKRQETDGQRIARLAKEKRQAQNKERMKNDFNAEMEREGIEESKPSADLSKAEKSAVVKKAKKGGDIGKPGKGFAKVEKAAAKGGAKDPKAVAAAAMWKNIKETVKVDEAKKKGAKPDFLDMDKDGDKEEPMKKAVADKKETVKESADLNRMKEFLTRLNG